MNAYTFHISLYDLAFLGTIFIGLNIAVFLWFAKKINQSANRFLALALVTIVLWMTRLLGIDIGLSAYIPNWSRLPLQFSLALGPLIYFYVLKITRPEYKFRWKDMLHFSPLLLELGALVLEIKESINSGAATYDTLIFRQMNPVLQLLAAISVITYLYWSHRLIERFYQRLKFNNGRDRYRYELRWLHRLLAGFGILWLLWIPYAAVDYFYYHDKLGLQAYCPLYLLLAVMMIWIAASAFLRPDAGAPVLTLPLLRQSAPAELKQKGKWLRKAMEANLLYRDAALSLSSLAETLNIHPHELSRIINVALKKNFNDFVNEYRIREIIRKMKDPAYDRLTLLGIALGSGFSSKTTFNRTFRQMTGKSPVECKNDLKKERPSYHLEPYLEPYSHSASVILNHETTPKWSDEKLNRNYMFKNYLKTAFRGFWKHKLFTLINITGLSIGITAALVIYLVVHYDFTFDKFHKDGDRIYRVVTNSTASGSPSYYPGVCGPLTMVAGSQVTGLQVVAPIFQLSQPNVLIPNHNATPSIFKSQDDVTLADGNYFNLFQYQWLAGKAQSALSEPFRVVLASDQAAKYFPGLTYDQMIGRIVIYDTIKTTVTGIVQTIRKNTDFTFHDFISYSTALANKDLKAGLRLQNGVNPPNWVATGPSIQLFVKLAPNTTVSHIARQLDDILKKNETLDKETLGPNWTQQFDLQPLADIHFNANYGTFVNGRVADKTTLYELQGIGLFLLLLGCINFINLTTAQSVQRAKEIGIRKTLGSTRKQLILQFLSETFLIVLIAVVISAAVAPVILMLFSGFIPAGVSANLINQPGIVVFLIILTITVGLLSGFYPALVLSGYKPVSVLKKQAQDNSGQTRNAWLRKSLTVTQFIIAQFFIMATVLVSKQIYYALHKDLGFKKDAIVIVDSPLKDRRPDLNRVLLNKLQSLPQIEMVSEGYDAPMSDWPQSTQGTYIHGKKEIEFDNLAEKFGDENYIKVYHIKLLAGRNLRPGDTAKAFLINNTLAKMIGFNDPHEAVGKVIDKFNGDTKMQIIGVVADFHQESIHTPVAPLVIFTSRDPGMNGTFHIALKPQSANGNDWHTAIAGMEKAWKDVYPRDDFNYHFFDENIARLYAGEQSTVALLNCAMGLSVLISCLGLLGLAIYTTNQRTKEIGVRKVVGASVTQIVVLLSTELIGLIILAFVIVTPIAWWAMHNWMQSYADRTAISWWIFVLSGLGMLLVAMLTSGFQTINAALTNPVKSLRSE